MALKPQESSTVVYGDLSRFQKSYREVSKRLMVFHASSGSLEDVQDISLRRPT